MKTTKILQRTKEVLVLMTFSFICGFIVFVIFACACNGFEKLFTIPQMMTCAVGLGIGSAVAFTVGKLMLDGFKK